MTDAATQTEEAEEADVEQKSVANSGAIDKSQYDGDLNSLLPLPLALLPLNLLSLRQAKCSRAPA